MPSRSGTHQGNRWNVLRCGGWVLLAILVAAAGCQKNRPITIGFVGCLTGRLSDLGIDGRNAVMLAVEDVNQAGGIRGRRVELLIRDDHHAPEIAPGVNRELIDAGAVAIIGHMTSTMSLAALPVINEARVLMVSPTSSSNAFTGLDDYFVRITPPNTSESAHIAEYLFHTLGVRRPVGVYDLSNPVFTEEWFHDFAQTFVAFGGRQPESFTFHSGEHVAYVELAQKMLDTAPDGVVIVAGALDTAMLCQHVRKLGADIPIAASGWSKSQDLVQHGGQAVEGVIFSESYDRNSQQPAFVAFQQRYAARFDRPTDFAVVFAYEAALVVLQALERQTRGQSLKEAVIGQTFTGLQGDISFDRYGENVRPRFLVTIHNEQFVTRE
jgi:branched-chain amino acid transport system substrate-binding protein